MIKTVYDVTSAGKPDAPAIGAPGRPWLGIGRGDRVAMVLPNGPEMAAAFLAVASGTRPAPLNPAYRADEFELLSRRPEGQGALIVAAGHGQPARAVAAELGVAVHRAGRARPRGPAGSFTLAAQALKPGGRRPPGLGAAATSA
jgi:acyl-CoA synthetase (AMP-forming)/AMP-acid ligase II